MRVEAVSGAPPKFDETTAILLPIYEGGGGAIDGLLSESDARVISRLIDRGVISPREREVYFVPSTGKTYGGVLCVGCGGKGPVAPESARRAAGNAVPQLAANRVTRVVVDMTPDARWPVDAFLEGLALGQYKFVRYKAVKDEEPKPSVEAVVLVTKSKRAADELRERCRRAALVCESVNWARDLANAASNDMTPAQLAYEARSLAEWLHLGDETLDEGRMSELGMHALLGVAKGSAEPPKLVALTYHHGHHAPTVAIVGKGVTFDTGGVSIKPAEKMHEMKWDMCGAAAVLGAMRVVGQLKPRMNVVCVVPAVENAVDARAQKPGDIVRAYNGKTIEVHNTDAEGRLILADALAYTLDHYRPDTTVDLATLTGAAVVALGHYAAAVMATDDVLLESLRASGEAAGERLWPMPLWEDYRKLIEGTHADVCNIGPPREAGTIIGGCFLREFVGDARWAHVDIAGTAYGAQHISYLDPKSASGFGVRLLSHWIESEAAAASKK